MLLQARTKLVQRKLSRATANSFHTLNSISTNPEIQVLVDKLQAISGQYNQDISNPLNLIEWKKTKYMPTQSQNRIRIQNRISLKKASDQKARPRIKPIKRVSQSVEMSLKQISLSYKDHYNEIVTSLNRKKKMSDDFQSEEDLVQIKDVLVQSQGFKYQENIKKYKNLTSYIEEKIQSRQSAQKSKRSNFSQKTINSTSNWKNQSTNKLRNTTQTIAIGDFSSDLKIDTIIRKWKPFSKLQKKMLMDETKTSIQNKVNKKQAKQKRQIYPSPRYSSQYNQQLSREKKMFSEHH